MGRILKPETGRGGTAGTATKSVATGAAEAAEYGLRL